MIDTTSYMTAAYVIATAIYIAYSISLRSRERRYRREIERDGAE
jgi:hypothetical protein